MSNFDWLDLDAKLLRLLVTVVDTGSITGAAQRLGVTQSAVSHLLDKLRGITGDVLFAKSGRGIVATARALALAERASALLGDLERFAYSENFDPGQWRTTFTIAANDFQRDALLPSLMQRLREHAPGVQLRVIPSDVPTPEMLRQEHCQLIISPRPPDGADMVQKRLFADRYRVFYDPAVRIAPASKKDYLASEHITVLYTPNRALDLDAHLLRQGIERRFTVQVLAVGVSVSMTNSHSGLARTRAMTASPHRLGRPLMIARFCMACSGLRPSSAPHWMAMRQLPGRPLKSLGTMSLSAR